jgi:hypothetical protein
MGELIHKLVNNQSELQKFQNEYYRYFKSTNKEYKSTFGKLPNKKFKSGGVIV